MAGEEGTERLDAAGGSSLPHLVAAPRPAPERARRIVICCDGTWNRPDQTDRGERRPTNVALLALAIPPLAGDGVRQVVYYHPGVGTGRLDRLRGGIFGRGLSRNVRHAYTYLTDVYDPDRDEIFLFGFSRGAYTARSLAGLIRNCGILRKEHRGRVAEAYKLYRRRDPASRPRALESTLFRASYSYEVRIRCVGVWDTVGSLGIPFGIFRWTKWLLRQRFHDVRLSRMVDNAFQALAIDERRRPFRPALWKQSDEARNQRLEQRWFAGVHCNIGGGYADTGLSDTALRWMVDRAESCGLVVDTRRLESFGYEMRPRATGELRDSMSLLYRLLVPIRRAVCKGGPQAHEVIDETVLERLKDKGVPYRPPNLPAELYEQATEVSPPA